MICILIFIFHQVFSIFCLHNASDNHKTAILSSKGILCCSSCFGPQYFPRIPNPILDNQTWGAKVARRPKWRLQQGRTLTLKQRCRHRQKPHLARRKAKSLYQGSMKSPCRHFHRWMMQRRQELAPFAVPSKAHFGWRYHAQKLPMILPPTFLHYEC